MRKNVDVVSHFATVGLVVLGVVVRLADITHRTFPVLLLQNLHFVKRSLCLVHLSNKTTSHLTTNSHTEYRG